MTTFYVPVEQTRLPAGAPGRWTILIVEAVGPVEAIQQARREVDAMHIRGWSVWAAVRDIPSFEYMQELRDSKDASTRRRKQGRYVVEDGFIPGYL
jgi:hypothetical protein